VLGEKIVVVGATGLVGREMLRILCEEGVPLSNVMAIASQKSKGGLLDYGNSKLEIFDLSDISFEDYDTAFFSAGSDVSRIYAPIAADAGCLVIDNTSYFRMNDDIPLVVPEVNIAEARKFKNKKVIANPNCSTIQMVVPLKPLHDAFGLRELVVSTYQSTSGAGKDGVNELMFQTSEIVSGNSVKPECFKKQIAFNVIPQIDVFTDNLYTKEELKMMNETKKILDLYDIDITATCVRVPVVIGHAVSVFAKFERNVFLSEVVEVLKTFKGVQVVDDANSYEYATPVDVTSKNDVFVSRLRKHPTIENALSFWCVADNLRKGAALNAIQIAKML
jgi:aspartate-semialdehyde dehydrogenase